jgi:hypothetical protein
MSNEPPIAITQEQAGRAIGILWDLCQQTGGFASRPGATRAVLEPEAVELIWELMREIMANEDNG